MNHELFQLIRDTGYLSDADMSPQQRYDLLTPPFWRKAEALGYDIVSLRRKLWLAAGRPEEILIGLLPEAEIQKAVRSTDKEKDPRKRIKETAAAIALLYKKAEKEIEAAISRNMENPDLLRAETGRIRRNLLNQAAMWLQVSIPGLYLAGSKANVLQGPHAKAAQAMAIQEYNRFKEIDSTIGRHIEEVIAEAEKRRAQAALQNKKPDYTGLRGGLVGHKTIDGKELGLASYVAMLAVTTARDFYSMGVQNGMMDRHEDLAMISREIRPHTCDVCRQWAGKTISISGRSKEYPSLDEALDAGLMHVNCIHYLIPVDYPGST